VLEVAVIGHSLGDSGMGELQQKRPAGPEQNRRLGVDAADHTVRREHHMTLDIAHVKQFERDGFVRVRNAFSPDAAAEMRDAVWDTLAARGVARDDPATWREDAVHHLQKLKRHPAFDAIGTSVTLGAIESLLGHKVVPPDWGAFFILFPSGREWNVPHEGWHVDHDWNGAVSPLTELKVQSLFGDVAPRAGGMTIVAGSHHVVAELVSGIAATKPRAIRLSVMAGHPYLKELSTPGDATTRIARFVDAEEDVLGYPLRVVELSGEAGDVFLIHPLVLHTRPTNAGSYPRFMLNKDLY
jgi:hypothetical protein